MGFVWNLVVGRIARREGAKIEDDRMEGSETVAIFQGNQEDEQPQ